jgi:hypothetical protein
MEKTVKIALAILLLICLAEMPYGFYQFVRFAGLVGFIFLAYQANEKGSKKEIIIYTCLAILFQPLLKISLGRTIWNIMDVIVGLALLISVFVHTNANNEK